MTFEKANLSFFIAFILIGGILGSALGTLAAKMVPALTVLKMPLTGAVGFDLEIIRFSITLNLASIAGMVFGFFLFRKV